MTRLRLAMAQMNPTVGDLGANCRKILRLVAAAADKGADLVIFPELAVTGYPPEDLLLKRGFIDANLDCMKKLAGRIKGITAIVGFVDRSGEAIYNAAALLHNRRIAGVYHKMNLPNYGVFDEKRYFKQGESALNFTLKGVTIGVEICEDIWSAEGPTGRLSKAGATLIANINASPYNVGKSMVRRALVTGCASTHRVAVAYANMVGGQDELVFDGNSMLSDSRGRVVAQGAPFEEDLIITDIDLEKKPIRSVALVGHVKLKEKGAQAKKELKMPRTHKALDGPDEILRALILGTGDYVRKNGFKKVCIGISGGIDSAVVAAIAVKALGAENVVGVMMPSRYTSGHSKTDAINLAKRLGFKLLNIAIDETVKSYSRALRGVFKGRRPDITEENLQARTRGNILMALSNKFGWLVLTTGNKSEMGVGYATLYGDMAGGFAVIKDVPKTVVYEVGRRINDNESGPLIPERIFIKAPSAELKPDQTDQDLLPPYPVLDAILKAYVEDDLGVEEIIKMGFKRGVVKRVARMVDLSEYKRRQAPPGVKITERAFGKDRRMPITNGYGSDKF